ARPLLRHARFSPRLPADAGPARREARQRRLRPAPVVRSTRLTAQLRFFRTLFRGITPVAPGAAASLALALFRRPPRHQDSPEEREAIARAEPLHLSLDGRPLAAWRWGHGPAVLLVHGWGSRGSRLGSFVTPLTAAGYSVVAFDAPGHGASAGRLSSLPQFISAIERLGR